MGSPEPHDIAPSTGAGWFRRRLRRKAAQGDIHAMRKLASVKDPAYIAAMREAYESVLGEEFPL